MPPGRGSSSAEVPFHRVTFSGSVRNANTVSGRAWIRTSSSPTSGRRTCAMPPPLLGLRLRLEDLQALAPHLLQERAHLLEALGPEAVDAFRPVTALGQ